MSLEKLLIKNRKCGSCSVCCTSLRIEQPTLKSWLTSHASTLNIREDVQFMMNALLFAALGIADGEFWI